MLGSVVCTGFVSSPSARSLVFHTNTMSTVWQSPMIYKYGRFHELRCCGAIDLSKSSFFWLGPVEWHFPWDLGVPQRWKWQRALSENSPRTCACKLLVGPGDSHLPSSNEAPSYMFYRLWYLVFATMLKEISHLPKKISTSEVLWDIARDSSPPTPTEYFPAETPTPGDTVSWTGVMVGEPGWWQPRGMIRYFWTIAYIYIYIISGVKDKWLGLTSRIVGPTFIESRWPVNRDLLVGDAHEVCTIPRNWPCRCRPLRWRCHPYNRPQSACSRVWPSTCGVQTLRPPTFGLNHGPSNEGSVLRLANLVVLQVPEVGQARFLFANKHLP